MSQERCLVRDVSVAYMRALDAYERHQSRGNSALADEAFTRMQEIEQAIDIREKHSGWRPENRRKRVTG